jgi:hypothetical protein
MHFRNLFLITLAFISILLAGTAAAQQPTPTPTPAEQDKTEAEKRREERRRTRDAAEERDVFDPVENRRDNRIEPRVPSSIDRTRRYRFEVGVMPRYNSNLFEAEDDAVKQSSYITTLSARAEYDLIRRDRRTLTGMVQLRRNIFKDVRNADSTDVDLDLRYRAGRNEFQTAYFITPRRLAFITGDALSVHNRVQGARFEYTRRLAPKWNARGAYQISRESFDGTAFDERDNTRQRVRGEVRYRFDYLFQPGIGVEYERVRASSENFDRNSIAPVLFFVSAYKDIVYSSARYRYIRYDYQTDNPLLQNFGRRDNRHDFSAYTSVKLARQWRLFGYYSTLDNNSSRPSRTFTGYQAALGIYFQWP